ncbi:MAG: lyase [Planctomycetes bacterium]|nr:lyase [Planctomycetota bacterium]
MNSLTSCLLAVLVLCAVAAASPGQGTVATAEPVLKSPPQKIVDQAASMGLIRYNRNCKGGAHTNGAWSGGSFVTLAVAAYAGNASADKRLLEQIRYNLKGENAISANGGYPAQHERHFTAACTLAKLTPRVWKQLSDEERHKIDLAMKAALVASAYTTSDKSYAGGAKVTALDGDANMNRGWNPNYQEGMIGMMVVGPVYFGPSQAQKILDTYDHEAFVAELKKADLTDIHETFTWKAAHPDSAAPTGKQIEQNVHGYRYMGHDLGDPMAIYVLLTQNTYGATVNAGLNGGKGKDGAGRIAKGAEGLPNMGKPGMLKEFDSRDAGGPRSCAIYAYDGFRPNLTNQIVLIAGGYWKKGATADECLALLKVGITDLFYKLENGYISYSKGHAGTKPFSLETPGHDFELTRSLWQDVVKPYHVAQAGK